MSFSRTDSGLAAEHLFYPEILVYVEGHTDIPKILGVRRPFSLKAIDSPQAQSGRLCYKNGNLR